MGAHRTEPTVTRAADDSHGSEPPAGTEGAGPSRRAGASPNQSRGISDNLTRAMELAHLRRKSPAPLTDRTLATAQMPPRHIQVKRDHCAAAFGILPTISTITNNV